MSPRRSAPPPTRAASRPRPTTDRSRPPLSASRFLPVFLALAGAAGGAAAQQDVDAGRYDGVWSARVPCNQRALCSARLVIGPLAGTWEELPGGSLSKGGCHGKPVPLTVQKSTPSELAFTVRGDTVGPDCPTLSIVVRPVNTRTLEGVFDFGVQELKQLGGDPDHTIPTDLTRQIEQKPGSTPDARPAANRSIRLQRR